MDQPEITLTPIRFHFYYLLFKPYNDIQDDFNSNSILNQVITFISNEKLQNRGYLIDRNNNRENELPRELFMTGAVIMARERRIRCSIALLRSGRIPQIKPVNNFQLISLEEMGGSIAEETNFFIDYSRNVAVICVEYNYHGPRISDIEYYLRNIARYKLKLSKATEVGLYMGSSIDKTLENLKNVLNIDIKLQPKKIAQMDKDIVGQYFTGLNSIGNNLKPNFLKLEAMFQSPGKNVTSAGLNNEANSMIKNILNRFKTKPTNIDCFENFVVKYEDKDGEEGVFNLLKEKKEIIKEVDLKKYRKKRQIYELIEKDFDEFMETLQS
jgi:hypothetical protein